MSAFREALEARRRAQPAPDAGRRWLFVPYDQLTDRLGALAREAPRDLGVILVEDPGKAARRRYHRQKLALVLANLRHFALEQAGRGVAIRHVVAREGEGYAGALARTLGDLGVERVEAMEPAERELRQDLRPLVEKGRLLLRPHEGWLTTPDQFARACRGGAPPYRMDAFYGLVRRESGVLMEASTRRSRPEAPRVPVGGRLSFDADNRRPWRGEPPAPAPPTFPRDPVKDEVLDLVATRFPAHPGTLDGDALPATLADAEALWARALEHCLPSFGPFEDAMSRRSSGLFHTRVSPLLNLHRGGLVPRRLLDDVLAMPDARIGLPSREGFVRQLLGWREFVHHVHLATDGLRRLPGALAASTDGAPSALGASAPLPPAYWGAPSGLACLDGVIEDVWREGWSHHITRLMVLGNIAQLLDTSPRALTDWFWEAYVDAFDWVVEPNVLGMATWAVADLMVTKPYVAGAAYLDRMGDFCAGCAFDPASTCPLTPLYWRFLRRSEPALANNPRLGPALASARRRSPAHSLRDQQVFERVRARLDEGQPVGPDDLPPPLPARAPARSKKAR